MLPRDLFDLKPAFAKELGVPKNFNAAARVLVVVGSNASGKSFLRRYVQATMREKKIEVIALSHELRTKGGMVTAFVYGDEAWQSTGVITAQTFVSGVRVMRSRTGPHVVIWDEPEIGMGEELQTGCADWLFSRLRDWPAHLQGVIVMTHSRIWARRAMDFPKARFLSLDGHKKVEDWLGREVVPVDPEALSRLATEKFRRLSKLLGK
jgi:hypothetical protein